MQFKELSLDHSFARFNLELTQFNTTIGEVFIIKNSYQSDPKHLIIEYERLFNKLKDSNHETNLARYLDLKSPTSKSQMELFIEVIEGSKNKVTDIQRPTNFRIYEFYLNFINVISQSKLFYLDYFSLSPSKSSGHLVWLKNRLDKCYHIIACSMKKSFDSITKLNHKNMYLNEKNADETINYATSYYSGKIVADKDL